MVNIKLKRNAKENKKLKTFDNCNIFLYNFFCSLTDRHTDKIFIEYMLIDYYHHQKNLDLLISDGENRVSP